MSTPQQNPTGYDVSSVMNHVHKMEGKLMLIHGLIDENVHFRHTARLINKLIEHRKRYELILFPCERHSPHKFEDKVYMEDLIFDFFCAQLRPIVSSNETLKEHFLNESSASLTSNSQFFSNLMPTTGLSSIPTIHESQHHHPHKSFINASQSSENDPEEKEDSPRFSSHL